MLPRFEECNNMYQRYELGKYCIAFKYIGCD